MHRSAAPLIVRALFGAAWGTFGSGATAGPDPPADEDDVSLGSATVDPEPGGTERVTVQRATDATIWAGTYALELAVSDAETGERLTVEEPRITCEPITDDRECYE